MCVIRQSLPMNALMRGPTYKGLTLQMAAAPRTFDLALFHSLSFPPSSTLTHMYIGSRAACSCSFSLWATP